MKFVEILELDQLIGQATKHAPDANARERIYRAVQALKGELELVGEEQKRCLAGRNWAELTDEEQAEANKDYREFVKRESAFKARSLGRDIDFIRAGADVGVVVRLVALGMMEETKEDGDAAANPMP